MIRKRFVFVLAALAIVAINVHAAEKAKPAAAPASWTGEVIDTGCYLGHGAKGAKHAECATKCIKGGMPMALLTDKGGLYLITMSHDDADPYQQLQTMAGKNVIVTGMAHERNGMKSIEITGVKMAAATTGAK